MNSNDLLDIIGETPDRYVLDAANIQQVRTKSLSLKRIWLIAAVVVLILCFVGCAVVYMLSLQDMKVGEYNFYVPPAYDEDGNIIPVETHAPITQLSLQCANMEALTEWLAFTNTYDQDHKISVQADKAAKAGNPWDIPENYHITYGCYSQEMVDKLDAIVKKYDLNLLSTSIICQHYEGDVILDALGLDSLVVPEKTADVEYGSGYFFIEGTFDTSMTISPDTADWAWGNAYISYRYSVKEYFDPVHGSISGIENCSQWTYIRKDGQPVLLVLSENAARIYADLPEAFVSIRVDTDMWENGELVPVTSSALEQVAELFDFSIQPQPVDMAKVERLKEQALSEHEAEKTALIEERENKYNAGYEEFVEYRLKTSVLPEYLSYLLYDLNGDGTDELVICGYEILSMKDNVSFKYFDIASVDIAGSGFYPCEGNIFELYHDFFATHMYYFYQAGMEGATFITGLIHDTNNDIWYRSLDGGAYDANREQITAEEAQQIRDAYTRIEIDSLPLQKYGQEVTSVNYTEPYSKYIAGKLDRYENAVNYEYALLDVNGDSTEELITRDVESRTNGKEYLLLSIHTIKDGKLWDMDMDYFTYVCEDGVLEVSEDYADNGNDSVYHHFYRCTENGVELIEKIRRDPITLYWNHTLADQERKTVTEEKAKSILDSYKRLELDWKPFTEYPFS